MTFNTFLSLGSNLGDRIATLRQAHYELETVGRILNASSFYETAAWGKTDQPAFINQVLEFQTMLPAQKLLEVCMNIERFLGRTRDEKWGARTIDIDILLYENAIIDTPTLQVPHPRMHLRRFVLVPMVELTAGTEMVPGLNKTVRQLLEECEDELEVVRTRLMD